MFLTQWVNNRNQTQAAHTDEDFWKKKTKIWKGRWYEQLINMEGFKSQIQGDNIQYKYI